jgi:hypothetical protein
MEFKGRIMKVLPVTSGTSQNGNEWKKQDFVFEYFEQQTDRYSDKVCLSIMNDRIAEYDLHENDEVLIGFGHSIREYQGRYFNELRLYKFQKLTQAQHEPKTAQGQAQGTQAAPNTAQAQAQQASDADPLPF